MAELEHNAWCVTCKHKTGFDDRWNLPHKIKEVLNLLEEHEYLLENFCYCSLLEEVRSLVAELDCDYYEWDNKI